ncbi:MAG: 4Fe-4S binding protein [Planctomycetes bacterium]|nr:4Fe-4S binding protein [Planctomycetota bacterium]
MEPAGSLRATLSAESQTLRPLKKQTLARKNVDPVKSREVVRRTGHAYPVASIDKATCMLCGACQAVCPSEAITLGKTAFKVNPEACCGCGACVEVCPNDAIRLN